MGPLELLTEHEKVLLANIPEDHPQKAYPLLCLDIVPYMASLGVLAHQKKAGVDIFGVTGYANIVEITKMSEFSIDL